MRKKIVIIGATSTIAHNCARHWIEKGSFDFVLIGRNEKALKAVEKDLIVRGGNISVKIYKNSLVKSKSISKTIKQVGPFDILLVAIGSLCNQQDLQNDLEAINHNIIVNTIAPILWVEGFIQEILAKVNNSNNYLKIAVIGSVAGDRGRKSNYLYGASKGALEKFIQGLQHRFAYTNVLPILIKPGPTETKMTAGLGLNNLASAKYVASKIVDGIQQNQLLIYTPSKWKIIMLIIKNLPKVIFHRLDI